MDFSQQLEQRYSRNILLEGVGREGQRKISGSRVLVVGSGGLGSAALLYLAAAGVGTLGVVDGDSVELSNLQRQVIHFTEDLGRPKTQSAKEKIHRLNPHVRIHAFHEFLDQGNMESRIRDYDFIIDGTDNFASKFLINDTCVALGKPFCHTGVTGFAGQMMTVVPGSACLRCVLPEPPPPDISPGSSRIGVLGALAGMFGSLQAAEAIKYIVGKGALLTDRLLLCDVSEMIFREVKIRKRPQCPACGKGGRP
ncbi:MAG: HesA/MoeB/ThiF family protein [Desulfobacteraceae bacterium]|nr:MAG: HesA/MoeB/ThiF family protein [Desulfobacteraceae bacterium]